MRANEAFYYEPDKLAEMFLNQQFVWHPQMDAQSEQYADTEQAAYRLRYWRGGFYIWHNGRYIAVSDGEMKTMATGFLQELNRQPYMPPDPPIKITQSKVNDVLLNLAGMAGVNIQQWRELNSWLETDDGGQRTDDGRITVSFLNGLLTFGEMDNEPEFVPHTPKYFSLNRLPFNYDRDAQCPRFEAFLDDVMQGDGQQIELLQEWAGYLLTNTLKFQKFLLLVGEGGNGKTVFTTTVEKMLGEENVSHVPLGCFGDRFSLAHTLGKMLNSTTESGHTIDELSETMLKSYTSGDRMTFEKKHRDPFDAYPTAKLMISTNQLPNFTDKSNAIFRRTLLVPFDKCIPADEQNPELVGELTEELPGIFNWAYEGLRKLTADGGFVEPRRCKEAIGEYRREINPARVFLEENYVEGFDYDGIPCGEMYQAYVAWCAQNGYHPLNNSNFGKEVKRAFRGIAKRHVKRAIGQVWIYSGLAVREDSEVYSGIHVGYEP